MDRAVKFLAFQVKPVDEANLSFSDCLGVLHAHPNRAQYTPVAGGARVRIEVLQGQGVLDGEFVRQQTENIPPIAQDGQPLFGNLNPIGHRNVFIYDPAVSGYFVEYNRSGVTPSKVNSLIRTIVPQHRGFFFDPFLTADALRRIARGTVRSVNIKVANPTAIPDDAGGPENIEAALGRFQDMLNSNHVSIGWGFPRGDRGGVLDNAAVRRLVDWALGHREHVRKLDLKIAEEALPIDMLGEQVAKTVQLRWPDDRPEISLQMRAEALRAFYNEQRPIIQQLYG